MIWHSDSVITRPATVHLAPKEDCPQTHLLVPPCGTCRPPYWIHWHLPSWKFGCTLLSQTNHDLNSLLKRNYSLHAYFKMVKQFLFRLWQKGRPQCKVSSTLLKQKVRSFLNAGVGSKKSFEECQGWWLVTVIKQLCLSTAGHER